MRNSYASALLANTVNECHKMWTRRRTKGFLLLTLIMPTIAALGLAFMQDRLAAAAGLLGHNLPLIMLSLYTFAILPLFAAMSAANSFAGETAARTLKLALLRPIARGKVYASKVLAIAAGIVAQLAALWVVSTLAAWLADGSGAAAGAWPDNLQAYAAASLPMIAIGLVAVLIAQCFRQSTGALALFILLYAAARLLPFALPQLAVWSVFSYTNWHAMWVGGGAAAGKLANTSVLLLAYCIMAYTAGWMLFERKQL